MPNVTYFARRPRHDQPKPRYDVLVVEDDVVMRDQLALALADEGYVVATAGDGAAALDLIRRADVGLVLLDLMLPVMSGRELSGVLRDTPELAEIPVVMVTAVNNVHVAPPGPVYLKPIRRDSLLRAVRLHLNRRPPTGNC